MRALRRFTPHISSATGDQSSERPTTRGAGGIRVIARAGQIMRALGGEREGVSLSELSRRVGLPRSTVHRFVAALESEGLAASVLPSGCYTLGPELLRLASDQYGELRMELRPVLAQLSAEVNETVDLSVLVRDHVSFIEQVAAPHRLRAVPAVGRSLPAHSVANGRALLAAHHDDVLRKLLPEQLDPATPNTTTDREALLEELATVRRERFAIERDEHTLGISAIGAVVEDASGAAAAIGIQVPTQRFNGNERALAAALLAATDRASVALGARRS